MKKTGLFVPGALVALSSRRAERGSHPRRPARAAVAARTGECSDVTSSTASLSTQRAPRLRDVTLPGWRRWAPQATVLWAVGYGLLRVYRALGHAPSTPPAGTDLILFTGWWSVVLCVAAAVAALALRAAPWSRPLAVGAWCVAVALVAASAVLLLDVVGILLPGIGVTVEALAFLSRVACLTGGVLLGATTLSYQRHWRGACLACGRTGEVLVSAPVTGPPRWARLAAWAAVAGCLVRLLAQLAVGFGSQLLDGDVTVVLFEGGFLIAGTVLPLATVYSWGRVFPRWVPLLAGRGVPRWLVLGPGLVLGVGMTAYFGVTLIKITAETLTGAWQLTAGSEPLWFFWIAVPAYFLWGVGLGVAALAYGRATRPPCRFCGGEA